ncbi:hypothetical protein SELMODRAFT_416600 [Selaginella moellendorffii]|uniref:Uncharacterized protein n=1 Tax=Selaginella moellendorffii TaxID=88036 RepID=D8RZU0_SELML|nr:hypothetical protein SELMODRAFT_416600 [Selaginella moellendorffii]
MHCCAVAPLGRLCQARVFFNRFGPSACASSKAVDLGALVLHCLSRVSSFRARQKALSTSPSGQIETCLRPLLLVLVCVLRFFLNLDLPELCVSSDPDDASNKTFAGVDDAAHRDYFLEKFCCCSSAISFLGRSKLGNPILLEGDSTPEDEISAERSRNAHRGGGLLHGRPATAAENAGQERSNQVCGSSAGEAEDTTKNKNETEYSQASICSPDAVARLPVTALQVVAVSPVAAVTVARIFQTASA